MLCDRFYFDDVLIDPLKYRYGGPRWLANGLRARLPGPDMYILLDAPEETVLARKQQAPLEEIRRLRLAYLELVRRQPRAHIIDASAPLDQVVTQASAILLDIPGVRKNV